MTKKYSSPNRMRRWSGSSSLQSSSCKIKTRNSRKTMKNYWKPLNMRILYLVLNQFKSRIRSIIFWERIKLDTISLTRLGLIAMIGLSLLNHVDNLTIVRLFRITRRNVKPRMKTERVKKSCWARARVDLESRQDRIWNWITALGEQSQGF